MQAYKGDEKPACNLFFLSLFELETHHTCFDRLRATNVSSLVLRMIQWLHRGHAVGSIEASR